MKLISEGKQSMKARGKQRVCPVCGARFEYDRTDRVDKHPVSGWDKVVCCWCKREVWVPSEEAKHER